MAALRTLPVVGAWVRCLGCDCIDEGVVNQVKETVHGVWIPCDEGQHYFALENVDDFEEVEPIFVTPQEREDLCTAVSVAYADGDAPIFEDNPPGEGEARVRAVEALLGRGHMAITQPILSAPAT